MTSRRDSMQIFNVQNVKNPRFILWLRHNNTNSFIFTEPLVAGSGLQVPKAGLQIAGYGLQVAGSGGKVLIIDQEIPWSILIRFYNSLRIYLGFTSSIFLIKSAFSRQPSQFSSQSFRIFFRSLTWNPQNVHNDH